MATIKSGFVWSDEPENFEDNNAIAIRLNKMMEDAEVIGGGGTGTVTSVAATVPTGLAIAGSPITTSGTLAISLASGYVIPTQSTLDGKQPLNANLTAYAGGDLPSAFTLGIVDSADAAAWRTAIGAGTSSFDGAYSSLSGLPTLGTMAAEAATDYTPTSGLGTMAFETATNYLTTSAAASTYEPIITGGTTGQYWRGDKSFQTLDKTAVGLSNVENVALSTWAGSTNITTLGTIATGVWQGTAVAVANGGTGATVAGTARTNLGLGTIATQAANNVSISGGAIENTPIGASTANTVRGTTITATSSFSGNLTGNVTGNVSGTAANVTGTVAVANGGTGATTAAAARVALLPSLASNAGKVLAVNGGETDVEFIAVGGSGTVTSVAATVPTGLTISGSPITTSGTLAFGLDTGYVIPTQATLDGKATKVEVDLGQYLNGNGTTDNITNWFAAQKALEPDGGITGVQIIEGGTGYTEGSYAVTFAGGSGTLAAATVVVSANGRIAAITPTTPGTGYHVHPRQTSTITSGSATLTLNASIASNTVTEITAGLAVLNSAFPAGTTVVSVNTGTNQVTVSANATRSGTFETVIFGLPTMSFSAGAGSGFVGIPIVGNGYIARIPPGSYLASQFYLMGLHNVTFEGAGARIIADNKARNGVEMQSFNINVAFQGITVQNKDYTVITPPASRGAGVGMRLKGYNISLENCTFLNVTGWAMSFGRDADTPEYFDYYNGLTIKDCVFRSCSADGVHLLNGSRNVNITGCQFIDLGDDAIAVFPDGGGGEAVYPPSDITISNCVITRNGWRGLFIGGSSRRVSASGLTISQTGNYAIGIERETGASGGPSDISLSGITIHSVGNTGDGFRAKESDRWPLLITNATRLSAAAISFGAIDATHLVYVADSTDVLVKAQAISGKTLYNDGGGNTNVTVSS
jgi:hypothetical protein